MLTLLFQGVWWSGVIKDKFQWVSVVAGRVQSRTFFPWMSYTLHSENEGAVSSDCSIQVRSSVSETGKISYPSGYLPVSHI